jgi:hypothetical protein
MMTQMLSIQESYLSSFSGHALPAVQYAVQTLFRRYSGCIQAVFRPYEDTI